MGHILNFSLSDLPEGPSHLGHAAVECLGHPRISADSLGLSAVHVTFLLLALLPGFPGLLLCLLFLFLLFGFLIKDMYLHNICIALHECLFTPSCFGLSFLLSLNFNLILLKLI